MCVELRQVGVEGERRLSGEREVEDAAERVDVNPSVSWAPFNLFGGDVIDAPEELPEDVRTVPELAILLIPKSVRNTRSPLESGSTRTLAGLTSRWTRPSACAASRAAAMELTRWTTRATGKGPSRATIRRRSAPLTRRIDR